MGAALAIIALAPCDGCSHRAPPEARKAYVTGQRIAKQVPSGHRHGLSRYNCRTVARPSTSAVRGNCAIGGGHDLEEASEAGGGHCEVGLSHGRTGRWRRVSGLRRSWARTIEPGRV